MLTLNSLVTPMCARTCQPQNKLQDQGGFTLLEVMIAISILAISMTMLFGSQSQSISLITESQFNTQVSLLSGLKIAFIESGKEELINGEGDFGDDFPGYSWKVEVETPSIDEPLLDEVAEEIKQVDLTISWGEERFAYTLRYYIHVGPQP